MSRTAAAADGDYRIEVTDFGPIEHAAVDLRPLTVFAGPSNTGKSYLAMLVYALHRFFGSFQPSAFRLPSYAFRLADSMVDSLPDRDALLFPTAEWWRTADRDRMQPLPDALADRLRPALERVGSAGSHLARELSRCFGVDAPDDLVRRGRGYRTRVIMSIPSAGAEPVRYHFEFGQSRTRFAGQVPPVPLSLNQADEEYNDVVFSGPTSSEDRFFLLREVLGSVMRKLIDPLTRSAYFLPADRTGVMHGLQVVVGTLIQDATTAGRRTSLRLPLLSGILADFLEHLTRMGRVRQRPERLARILERNVLPGTIRLRRSETGYPSFAYRPAGWDADVPLMRTSSMVSELAPVVLYLRYFVRPEDVLIIEEPESHLHPAMQAAFARELARLVHAGVRVMLTTHSEWMLEAIANLVRLAEIPERERKGITGSDVALPSNQVGAWMFTPNAERTGSKVKEIPLDTEAGSFPAGYGEITESLYNDWARISNRIAELRSSGA